VSLTRERRDLRLEVSDQGVGMPRGLSADGAQCAELGVGMQGIHERVRQLQGHMEIRSEEGKGTTVTVTIPESTATVPAEESRPKVHAVRTG
jgi:signal transduction histidine kinase